MSGWGGRVAQRLVLLTLATYGTRCHLCGQDGANSADHLIPRSRGGLDLLENLRPAHRSCNYARGDMPLDRWFAAHPLPVTTSAAPSRRW